MRYTDVVHGIWIEWTPDPPVIFKDLRLIH